MNNIPNSISLKDGKLITTPEGKLNMIRQLGITKEQADVLFPMEEDKRLWPFPEVYGKIPG